MGLEIKFYDRDGMPITIEEFGRLQEDFEYKVVSKWHGDGIEVSTVWLGLDHSWSPEPHVPVIFETMIFTDDDDHPLSTVMTRYATLGEAQEGHLETVKNILEGEPIWFMHDGHTVNEADIARWVASLLSGFESPKEAE